MEKCILYLQWKSDSLVCKDMDQPKIRYETKKSTNIPEKEDCVKKEGKEVELLRSVSALLFKYMALTNCIR